MNFKLTAYFTPRSQAAPMSVTSKWPTVDGFVDVFGKASKAERDGEHSAIPFSVLPDVGGN